MECILKISGWLIFRDDKIFSYPATQ
jgi:hypothetical protein